jgi:hypothetical protein
MAFLDNSGDIILDAVLTELGRKRMSSGRFRISKFAFGDDEINYQVYNKNHPSGSAYYDLEILQTPIFEATTGKNSQINFGLMTISNRNILYMPVIKRNELVTNSAQMVSNVYYLAVRDGITANALAAAFGGASTADGNLKVLRAGKPDGTAIVLETGLDTTEIAATRANKASYLVSNGLQETNFAVSIDTRFLSVVHGPGGGTTFNNNGEEGESRVRIRLTNSSPSRRDRSIANHSIARIAAINNNVFKSLTDAVADTATSVIAGPRASMTALNFSTQLLTADDYSRHGRTGQTIAGAAGTYRYIDTTVKIVGSTGITDQLPIRIIQKE